MTTPESAPDGAGERPPPPPTPPPASRPTTGPTTGPITGPTTGPTRGPTRGPTDGLGAAPGGLSRATWLVHAGRGGRGGPTPGQPLDSPLNVPPVLASNFVLGGPARVAAGASSGAAAGRPTGPGAESQSTGAALARPEGPGAQATTPAAPPRGYARDGGSPTWEAFEEVVGGLEAGRAVAFASGMAAIAAVFDQLPCGARVVIPDDCYQGVTALAARGQAQGRWTVERLPIDDTDAWVRACAGGGRGASSAPATAATDSPDGGPPRDGADLLWLESPSNPLLTVAELPTICATPRKPGAILAVDNTLATPLNQRPLELGADLSVHSATKYLGGHSDLLLGVVIARGAGPGAAELHRAIREARALAGATPGALEAFLATRGLRTLAVRIAASQATALELAHRLERDPRVERVRHPGLASHATHAIAARTLGGFGSIVSFDVVGGAGVADAVCAHTRLIRHATSLGAVESTMERRAAVPGQEHLPAGLLRLSVGCEAAEDLWHDLDRALAEAPAGGALDRAEAGAGAVSGEAAEQRPELRAATAEASSSATAPLSR